jgi:hypothetical protein
MDAAERLADACRAATATTDPKPQSLKRFTGFAVLS